MAAAAAKKTAGNGRPSQFSRTSCGCPFFAIAAVGLFLLAWQQTQPQQIYAAAFSVERDRYLPYSSRATTAVVAFASRKDDGQADPNPSLVSDLPPELSKPSEREGTNSSSDTTATSTATVVETDSFLNFAANRTPLLAELLSLNEDNENDDDDAVPLVSPPAITTSPATVSGLEDSSRQLTTSWKERSSELVVVALATCTLVGFLGDLLSNYEWAQTLRYFWPLSLGVYYGLLWNKMFDARYASLRETAGLFSAISTYQGDDPRGLLLRLGYVFGGFSLFVGGLADAVLPVWMTGPNWITNAGLAPDCAVLLLLLSVGEEYYLGTATKKIAGERETKNSGKSGGQESLPVPSENMGANNDATTAMTPLLLRIALYAELYKLGESSLDEVFSGLQTLLSSST